ncbi:MAG: hypothetical protein E4H26_04595 [Flavobacteriales bacterium]|nr:MAG: hypothetical protein E4H26_04595 [Flavobacteriales bacterium]
MQNFLNVGKPWFVTITLALLVFSCSKDNDNDSTQDVALTQTEVKTVLKTNDVLSVADGVLTDLFQNGQAGKSAKAVECYLAEYTDTGFTVTFDNCSIDGSENLNGSLSAEYIMGEMSSSISVTFTELSIGGYILSGTRTYTFSNEQTSSVEYNVTSEMSVTLPDGTLVSETGTKTIGIVFDELLENASLTIDGEWVVTVDGDTYSVNVTDLLETNIGCEYIAKGVMLLSKNGLQVSVDFGDGTCDNTAVLGYPDGTEEEFTLKD